MAKREGYEVTDEWLEQINEELRKKDVPRTLLKLCAMCAKLLRPQDLEETEHSVVGVKKKLRRLSTVGSVSIRVAGS